ncbi:hypothetical protein B4U80_08827 [Leptotrombidium deliense]|uniref:Uncharacterized protein n=1 Tax=Leptotrombidium deliense TaxID=299467 RepID=A0A443RXU4_9ACAR|nr:hypothetical protein B4U80_08827 [Leptotrombidium deliense]
MDFKTIAKYSPNTFDRILYFYSVEQSLFYEIKKYCPNIIFTKDLQNTNLESFDGSKCLIILDDMMVEATENQFICDVFTKGSHHKNVSVILILQNFFYKGKLMRTISLNAHYIVLFKNPRDRAIINHIGRQICPEHLKCFTAAFGDATRKAYGYFFIDLKPYTDDRLRYLTNIFNENNDPRRHCIQLKNDTFVSGITEIAYNIVNRKVPISKNHLKKIKKQKLVLKRLLKAKKIGGRRRIIQSGEAMKKMMSVPFSDSQSFISKSRENKESKIKLLKPRLFEILNSSNSADKKATQIEKLYGDFDSFNLKFPQGDIGEVSEDWERNKKLKKTVKVGYKSGKSKFNLKAKQKCKLVDNQGIIRKWLKAKLRKWKRLNLN